ncbi:MAG: SLC13/DASS family transporter [Bacteriovoracaceae bacterium]|jgi:solute carrier family 13 (sodium-dependent dicarboxylate transporter), member 2/3/5|nr:SLC13/DASS family transporter [Bacteriovoracaceae bacterium]
MKPSFSARTLIMGIGVGALIITLILGLDKIQSMSVVALVMALWWIFEVLPLGITALIPMVAYPLFGIASSKEIAPIYMSSVLMLFIGGFFVAIAMQKWNLHKRIALSIISVFGCEPGKLMAGFMCATGFLSMWISNTASAVMMVSIGLAVIKSYEEMNKDSENGHHFACALMLSIAYSATIGGISTLVGTPPNLAFTRIFAMSFPTATEISFGSWILFGIPISIAIMFVAWTVLFFINIKPHGIKALDPQIIKSEKDKLGKMSYEEKNVAFIFITMALLWIFRKNLNLGLIEIPGWSNLLAFPKNVDDGTVAILMASLLFILPSKKEGRLLTKDAIRKIPWSTILLFGGGFALAKGIQSSGLSSEIGNQFSALGTISPSLVVVGITGGMSFLTELTSNMASTEMLLPILASIAKASGINPLVMMVPATLAASCAFMLPAATAPNAIVFGSEKVRIIDMVKSGFLINLLSIVIISIFSLTIIPFILK